jgi:hypothetical protein
VVVVVGMTVGEALALDGGSERMVIGERSPVAEGGMYRSWTRKINGTRYAFTISREGRMEVDQWSSGRGWLPVHRWADNDRTPVWSRRSFAGMVYPDVAPLTVGDRWVTRAHVMDIPATLREHACTFLDRQAADGAWWTVGEFRYYGGDYVTAVARRVLRAGRVAVEYGIEGD